MKKYMLNFEIFLIELSKICLNPIQIHSAILQKKHFLWSEWFSNIFKNNLEFVNTQNGQTFALSTKIVNKSMLNYFKLLPVLWNIYWKKNNESNGKCKLKC